MTAPCAEPPSCASLEGQAPVVSGGRGSRSPEPIHGALWNYTRCPSSSPWLCKLRGRLHLGARHAGLSPIACTGGGEYISSAPCPRQAFSPSPHCSSNASPPFPTGLGLVLGSMRGGGRVALSIPTPPRPQSPSHCCSQPQISAEPPPGMGQGHGAPLGQPASPLGPLGSPWLPSGSPCFWG